jgi:putative oxidoreductase
MHKFILSTMHYSPSLQHLGFTLIRVSFGIIFAISGYNKVMSGNAHLTQLGSAMGLFGITWGYLFWGYMAAFSELVGGITIALGFCTRLASLPLAWLLIVAIRLHVSKGDPFMKWSFACMCLCIVISFVIAGSGIHSVDHLIESESKKHTY